MKTFIVILLLSFLICATATNRRQRRERAARQEEEEEVSAESLMAGLSLGDYMSPVFAKPTPKKPKNTTSYSSVGAPKPPARAVSKADHSLFEFKQSYKPFGKSINAAFELLKPKEWIKITKDGSCFYNAFFNSLKLSGRFDLENFRTLLKEYGLMRDSLYSLEHDVRFIDIKQSLRALLAKFLLKNKVEYKDFLAKSFEAYLKDSILNVDGYADQISILAISKLFNINIRVIRLSENTAQIYAYVIPDGPNDGALDSDKAKKQITVVYFPKWYDGDYFNDAHYELLI